MTIGTGDGASWERLRDRGVERVRVTYSDLHGYPRGKLLPLARLDAAAGHGLMFCQANLTDDLRGHPVDTPGGYPSQGYPDMRARADLATLAVLPWDAATAWCLADLLDRNEEPLASSPRAALTAVIAALRARGLEPICAPELEFFLCRRTADGGLVRYVDRESMVYTVDALADPDGVLGEIMAAAEELGLGVLGAAHEYARSQYEVNLAHGPALDAADRAFRFKAVAKEVAARRGLVATFMGRPFNDEGGSGFHLHVSFVGDDGELAFAHGRDGGLGPLARRAVAGVIAHARALSALCAPTVNAYKRLLPGMLAPTHAGWGSDNRTVYLRVPPEGGAAARIEFRAGDGSANPYILTTAVLAAILDGIERELVPGEPQRGDTSFADGGTALPRSLGEALDELDSDRRLCQLVGRDLVRDFLIVKRHELHRFQSFVTDWEIVEYSHHL